MRTSKFKRGLAGLAVALGMASSALAQSTYTVPDGVYTLEISVSGAGGGGGHSSYGGNGATMTATIAVTPGDVVQYWPPAPGQPPIASLGCTAGPGGTADLGMYGAGGAGGMSHGGDGGDAGESCFDENPSTPYPGAGGGSDGVVMVNGFVMRAGGGGGGSGAYSGPPTTPPTDFPQTNGPKYGMNAVWLPIHVNDAACATSTALPVEQSWPSSVYGSVSRSSGEAGGGGGGGYPVSWNGTANNESVIVLGTSTTLQATGGYPGGSCWYATDPSMILVPPVLSDGPSGGAPGQPGNFSNTPGSGGGPIFKTMTPDLFPGMPASANLTIGVPYSVVLTINAATTGDSPDGTVVVALPANVGFSGATPTGCTATAATLTCPLPAIGAGTHITIGFDIVAAAYIGSSTGAQVEATISGVTGEVNKANNVIDMKVSTEPEPDLTPSLSGTTVLTAGMPGPVQVTVSNVGDLASSDGLLTVNLPAGIALSGSAPSGCVAVGTTGFTCDLTAIATGANTAFEFNVIAASPIGSELIVATVSAVTGDYNGNNDSASMGVSAIDAPDAIPSLAGSTDVGVNTPSAVMLTVTNMGTATETDGIVNVSLPFGLELSGAVPAGCTAMGTSALTCDLTTLNPGENQKFTFDVTAPAELTGVVIMATTSGVTGMIDVYNNVAQMKVGATKSGGGGGGGIGGFDPAAVPTLGEYAAFALVIAIAVFGVLVLRRRKSMEKKEDDLIV